MLPQLEEGPVQVPQEVVSVPLVIRPLVQALALLEPVATANQVVVVNRVKEVVVYQEFHWISSFFDVAHPHLCFEWRPFYP